MRPRTFIRRFVGAGLGLGLGLALGCGTTRTSDTTRTATEQLLTSNAIDKSVDRLDFHSLSGKPIFFDTQYLDGCVDKGYLVSSIRQQLLASGCLLMEEKARATYVIEARAGAVGTDQHQTLIGIPQMQMPAMVPGAPSALPEIPLAKKSNQLGVAKIALFAYNRQTGQAIMQSGMMESTSTAKEVWFLGAGPFQNGTIRRGMVFAGESIPSVVHGAPVETPPPAGVSVIQAALWAEGPALIPPETSKPKDEPKKDEAKSKPAETPPKLPDLGPDLPPVK
jgi:hypothetical protein